MEDFKRILIMATLIASFLISFPLLAKTRGVSVISKEGQPLYLYKDYHAIVIGIGDYDHWPKLPNAVRDAREVAGKLRTLGFEVKLLADVDSRQLKSTLTEIARRLGTERNRALLLYFAGHGETTKLADGTDLGYIIPKDCPLQMLDPFGFDSKAISMKEIEMLALKVKSKHMLAVFDSCFSGSLFSLSRAAPTDISEKSAKPVRQFMTAGGADETVPDRSIFKVCFLRGLDGDADYNRDSYVTASELGLYLQTKVINYTRGAQHPQFGKINNPYLDRGDFIFVLESAKRQIAKTKASNASNSGKESAALRLERLKRERERLEAEERLLDKERQRLAYIPKTVTSTKLSLRKEPKKQLSKDAVRTMVKNHDFFDSEWNPNGTFANDFVNNGDGTVTDKTTGLMWQRDGSPKAFTIKRAAYYIRRLNDERFMGYSDWRMPTIDELASIITRNASSGLHINPLFTKKQTLCWSSDSGFLEDEYMKDVWIANFAEGKVVLYMLEDRLYLIGDYMETYYVRGVRSIR